MTNTNTNTNANGAGAKGAEAFTDGLGSGPARETVDKMVDAGLLDDLMARVDQGGLRLTGEGGFLPELTKRVLEAGLQADDRPSGL